MTPAANRRTDAATVRRRWFAWVALLGLLLAGCATEGLPQSAMDPAGPIARSENNLWNYVFPIAVAVFILVQGLILWAVFRYRDRGGDDIPKQVAGNTRLELLWTVIPALILVGIAVPTVGTIFELSREPGEDALDVRVVAKQYWWEFEYLGDEGQGVVTANELHIPTGRPVFLQMQSLSATLPDPGIDANPQAGDEVSAGVLHSFWVPRLAGKQDVVPGHTRRMTIEADEPGEYPGQCAEFCGLSHARMRFQVIAHEPAEYEQWLEGQTQPAQTPQDALAQEGEALFEEQTCFQCHAVNGYEESTGTAANIRIGPDLTHFASRQTFAGGVFDVDDEEQLRAWLANPQAVKAGSQMPNLGLSEEHIDALTAYLYSLE
ncbi:MAG TPA: cytochrome c oxidase subunit II transmembrane domain-containing protein [Euzebyales bacterium]|nr:cytochrome c oxidase subunit II transmembrane domain-containing protein [Euzebyales bacterium]